MTSRSPCAPPDLSTTDGRWAIFQAACDEVGIDVRRCPDHDGSAVYELADPWQYRQVDAHRASAIGHRAAGAVVMRCFRCSQTWEPCEVPVDVVLTDPATVCDRYSHAYSARLQVTS